MTAAARRAGNGPERPTLTEWLIGFLPLPFVAGSLLLALLFGIPRELLGTFLDTWDLDAALGLLPPVGGGLLILVLIVDVSVYLSIPLATRYMRRQVVKAKEAISPLLPQGEETYLRVFSRISSFWPALLIGAVFIVFLLPAITFRAGPFTTILGLPFLLLFFPILGAFVWIYVSSTLGLYQLGRGSLRMKSYMQDPALGLRPLGSLSFSLAWPYLAAGGIAALWVSLGVPGPGILLLIAALLIVGVVMFFVPLYAVHRRMVRERERAHASVQDRLWERAEKADTPEREGGDPTLLDIMNRLARLEEASRLDRAERRINEIYDWPFDARIAGRFAALTLTVVAVLLTRYAATLFGI
ncbi:MAG: hypothetical protein LN413_06170 [Candidatus Thermoplasmatota archaeon]|nr:hypothetical protein [Candidatus Thermoplasmatota archaeon]